MKLKDVLELETLKGVPEHLDVSAVQLALLKKMIDQNVISSLDSEELGMLTPDLSESKLISLKAVSSLNSLKKFAKYISINDAQLALLKKMIDQNVISPLDSEELGMLTPDFNMNYEDIDAIKALNLGRTRKLSEVRILSILLKQGVEKDSLVEWANPAYAVQLLSLYKKQISPNELTKEVYEDLQKFLKNKESKAWEWESFLRSILDGHNYPKTLGEYIELLKKFAVLSKEQKSALNTSKKTEGMDNITRLRQMKAE